MQQFLSGVMVISGSMNYKHFVSSKNDGLNNFCNWYEFTTLDTKLLFTLFAVQNIIEDNNNQEAY